MADPIQHAHVGREIRLFGRPFWTDDLDSLNLTADGGFERNELEFVARSVHPGAVCVDVGANIGVFTVALAHAAGAQGRVYAFEPDPYNFQLLRRNTDSWRQSCDMRLRRAACSDTEGTAVLHASAENRGMHRLYESVCCSGPGLQVPTVVLDNLIREQVNFVKIDIEGFEPYAVRGLAATLKRSPSVTLLSEFSPLSMLEAGGSASAYLATLQLLGFAPHSITDRGPEPIDSDRLRADCLKLESGDFKSLMVRCAGQSASQIFEVASRYAVALGYCLPLVQNLAFLRRS